MSKIIIWGAGPDKAPCVPELFVFSMNIVKISQKQVESLKDYLKKRMQPMLWVTNALNTTAYDKIDGQDCIDYWRSKHPGRDDKTCRFTKRNAVGNDIIVGGHVISVYVKEPKVYITPI